MLVRPEEAYGEEGESTFLAGLQDVTDLVRAANCTMRHSGRLCRSMADIKGLEVWPEVASTGDGLGELTRLVL